LDAENWHEQESSTTRGILEEEGDNKELEREKPTLPRMRSQSKRKGNMNLKLRNMKKTDQDEEIQRLQSGNPLKKEKKKSPLQPHVAKDFQGYSKVRS